MAEKEPPFGYDDNFQTSPKEPHTIEDVLENKDTVDQLKKWLDK